jgi:hypothetical protein
MLEITSSKILRRPSKGKYLVVLSLQGRSRYVRHDPKNTVRENFNKISLPWEYTTDPWEEEEVHQSSQTYDDVTFNRHSQLRVTITDEEKAREEAQKKAEEEEAKQYPCTSS